MDMMGDDIYFFGDDTDGKIPGDKTPEPVAESIRVMGAIPVIPDGSMGSHDDHAVNKGEGQKWKRKIVDKEYNQAGNKEEYFCPAEECQPVLLYNFSCFSCLFACL